MKLKKFEWWEDDLDEGESVTVPDTIEEDLVASRLYLKIPSLADLHAWACDQTGRELVIPMKVRLTYETEDGDHYIIIYPDPMFPNIPFAIDEDYPYSEEMEDLFDEEEYDKCHFYRDYRYLELWRIADTLEQNLEEAK